MAGGGIYADSSAPKQQARTRPPPHPISLDSRFCSARGQSARGGDALKDYPWRDERSDAMLCSPRLRCPRVPQPLCCPPSSQPAHPANIIALLSFPAPSPRARVQEQFLTLCPPTRVYMTGSPKHSAPESAARRNRKRNTARYRPQGSRLVPCRLGLEVVSKHFKGFLRWGWPLAARWGLVE